MSDIGDFARSAKQEAELRQLRGNLEETIRKVGCEAGTAGGSLQSTRAAARDLLSAAKDLVRRLAALAPDLKYEVGLKLLREALSHQDVEALRRWLSPGAPSMVDEGVAHLQRAAKRLGDVVTRDELRFTKGFDELYRRGYTLLRARLKGRIRDPDELERAMGAAWINAFKSISNIKSPEEVVSWLVTIAMRCHLTHLKTTIKQRAHETSFHDLPTEIQAERQDEVNVASKGANDLVAEDAELLKKFERQMHQGPKASRTRARRAYKTMRAVLRVSKEDGWRRSLGSDEQWEQFNKALERELRVSRISVRRLLADLAKFVSERLDSEIEEAFEAVLCMRVR